VVTGAHEPNVMLAARNIANVKALDKWPVQQFSIAVRSKDRGFVLKNFGEKGWGLFDLQTLSVQMTDDAPKDKTGKTGLQQVSLFTEILSKAANDPSLKEKPIAVVKVDQKPPAVQPVVVKEEVKTLKGESIAKSSVNTQSISDSSSIAKKETTSKGDTIAWNPQKSIDPLITSNAPVKKETDTSKVEKQLEKNETSAITNNQSINDSSSIARKEVKSKKDTTLLNQDEKRKPVDTLIASKTALKNEADTLKVEKHLEKNETTAIAKIDSVKKADQRKVSSPEVYKKSHVTKRSESSTTEGFGLVFIDELSSGEKDTIRILIANSTTSQATADKSGDSKKFLNVSSVAKDGSVSANSIAAKKCTSLATQDDFLKLRKKMASQKSDEAMINESKKAFKVKCFTTEQVKNLGNLFLNEATKFQFYEVAYPVSFDRNNFASLQAEFKDAYFIHRFKKLVN
jgi:hypothetical protein